MLIRLQQDLCKPCRVPVILFCFILVWCELAKFLHISCARVLFYFILLQTGEPPYPVVFYVLQYFVVVHGDSRSSIQGRRSDFSPKVRDICMSVQCTPCLKSPTDVSPCHRFWIRHCGLDVETSEHAILQCLATTPPRLRNNLLCVEWDVKPYTLTPSRHSRQLSVEDSNCGPAF